MQRASESTASGTRRLLSAQPIDVAQTLRSLRRGSADPALTVTTSGVWWCTNTPDGPGTINVSVAARDRSIDGRAWGEGASWLLEQLPQLLGASDSPDSFSPADHKGAKAWRRHRHVRVGASGRVFEACAASVIEQKVTGIEARHSWRTLLRRFGTPAPGPVPREMFLPPAPMVWAELPDWDYRAAGVTPQRIRTLRAISVAAAALERMRFASQSRADQVLQSLPGVGVWTSAEVRQRALGDADAVSFGDFHVAKNICWWLTGESGDDARMAELLEPFRGHRYRVQRLMELEGIQRPRRAPRFAPPSHRFA